MIRPEEFRHPQLELTFVELRVLEGYGESLESIAGVLADDGGRQRRIEAAAQVSANRNVGPQTDL